MEKLRTWLNIGLFSWDNAGRDNLLEAGKTINNPGLLSEDWHEEIVRQIDKLIKPKKQRGCGLKINSQKDMSHSTFHQNRHETQLSLKLKKSRKRQSFSA
jgi:hypothetical protein